MQKALLALTLALVTQGTALAKDSDRLAEGTCNVATNKTGGYEFKASRKVLFTEHEFTTVYREGSSSFEVTAVAWGKSVNFQLAIKDSNTKKVIAVSNSTVVRSGPAPENLSIVTEALPGFESASFNCWIRW